MRFLFFTILAFLILFTQGQPKNPKDLRRNCEKYIFNPENVKFKIKNELQYYVEEVIVEQWQDTVSYYHGICRKPLPVVFENSISDAIQSAIDKAYVKTKGHIPVMFSIKNFRYIPIKGQPDLFQMIFQFYLKKEDGDKLIYMSELIEVAQGAYFEKRLSKMLKSALLELHWKNPFFVNLPYYENQEDSISNKDGLLLDWNSVVNKAPVMEYPCEMKVVQHGYKYSWYRIGDCEFENYISPRTILGLVKNDSIFVNVFARHFVYLEPIGNGFFLAKDHIFDQSQVYYNSFFFGLAGAILTVVLTEKNVFYLFDKNGNITLFTLKSIKKAIADEPDLLRKYKKLRQANGLQEEMRKMIILELLRRQGKIP